MTAHAGLWFSATCRQCGDLLDEIQSGRSDGVRTHWVGKCRRCRREYAVMVEMIALHDPSLHDRKYLTRTA